MHSNTRFATILLKVILKASIAILLGFFLSVFSVGWALHLLKDNLSGVPGVGGHGGGIAILILLVLWPLILFNLEPWSATLLFVSLLLPFFYAFLSWKIGIGEFLQLAYVDYVSDSLRNFVDRSSYSVSKHLEIMQKSKYVQNLSDFQKKVFFWVFKKIPFDVFSKKELELKFEQKMGHSSRLAKRIFWILFTLHASLVVIASLSQS